MIQTSNHRLFTTFLGKMDVCRVCQKRPGGRVGELHFFLYKNQLYKNKETQNDPKFKNKLRTTPASKSVNILRTSSEWRPWRRWTTNFLIKISCRGLKGSQIFENLRAKSFFTIFHNTRSIALIKNEDFQ